MSTLPSPVSVCIAAADGVCPREGGGALVDLVAGEQLLQPPRPMCRGPRGADHRPRPGERHRRLPRHQRQPHRCNHLY